MAQKFIVGKIVKIWFQTFFYSIFIAILFLLFTDSYGLTDTVRFIFPVKSGIYWFVTKYLALLALSPFLAKCVERLSKKSYQILLFVLSFIQLEFYHFPYGFRYENEYGNSIMFFITLFLWGGYLARYYKNDAKQDRLYFYIVSFSLYLFDVLSVTWPSIINNSEFHY